MKTSKFLVVSLMFAYPFIVSADNPKSCLQTAMTQSELNQCAGVTYKEADKELNRVYKKIRELYKDDPVFLEKMKKAQLAWIKLRDADFEMMYPHHNEHRYYGSSFSMCSAMYTTKLTMERIAYLKTWLVGVEEGDVCSGSQMYDHNIRDLLKK